MAGVFMVLDSVFPPQGGGGAEFQVKTLAEYFTRHGLSVTVIVPMLRAGPASAHEVRDGVEIRRLRYPRIRWLGGAIMLLRLAALLMRERRRYVAVHAHIAHTMAAVSCLVGRMLDKQTIVKITGLQELQNGILAPHANTFQRLLRRAIRRATWVQATSCRIRSALTQCGFAPQRVLAIPNAVDMTRFYPSTSSRQRVRAELQTPAEGRVIIYSGRLEAEKGVGLLIEAWAAGVPPSCPHQLWLVGGGSQLEPLRARVRDLGREKQIAVLGPRDRIEDYLNAADACVLPSFNEGLSNSLLEAMACALPVLGTRVSGTEDFVVPNATGYLVEPRDGAAMSRALDAVLDAPTDVLIKMGRHAFERIATTATIDRVAGQLAQCYGVTLTHGPRESQTTMVLGSEP